MKASFVAVDAGGTSTRAIVFDAKGTCLGRALGAGANPFAVGNDAALEELANTINKAVASCISPNRIAGVTAALAGASRLQSSQLERLLQQSGLTCPVSFESDQTAMYWSAGPQPTGCALIAGTGSAAIAMRDGKIAQIADGGGWLIGDRGSGFWCGRAVASAVLEHLDGTGPETALTKPVFTHYGLAPDDQDARELFIRQVYDAPPRRLAELARFVMAHQDDPVAQSIIDGARNALVATLASVIRADTGGHIVLGGSIALHLPGLREAIGAHLVSAGHTPSITSVKDGLVGAAHLLLEHDATTRGIPRSWDERQSVFERLTATVGSFESSQ